MRAMSAPDIPGYRILRPLNSGGMATVYLAEQLSLGREVAIKLIADHLRTDAGFAERFAQEARIASRLDHPHIVTVFDYGTVPDGDGGAHHYLVMARIEGADYHRALPGLSLPCGFGAGNLPVGLQLIGNHFDEARLLNVAHRYQQATDWHQRRPALAE